MLNLDKILLIKNQIQARNLELMLPSRLNHLKVSSKLVNIKIKALIPTLNFHNLLVLEKNEFML